MESNDPTADDLSESSESNSSSVGSCHSDEPLPSFQPYRRLDSCTPEDERPTGAPRYTESAADQPIALDKPKDYATAQRPEADWKAKRSQWREKGADADKPSGPFAGPAYSEPPSAEEPSSAGAYRSAGGEQLTGPKDAMYSFCREIREMRQKSLASSLAGSKDFELGKAYGLGQLERPKEFGFASRLQALDRLCSGPMQQQQPPASSAQQQPGRPSSPRAARYPLDDRLELCLAGEATPAAGLDQSSEELKALAQARAPLEASVAFERLRHAHPAMFQPGPEFSTVQSSQAPPHHHAITQLGQMQQAGTAGAQQQSSSSHHHLLQQQQQHPQHPQHPQQAKSFTIDAILGLRASGQRDKHPRYHPYKKQQGQEGGNKSLGPGPCSNGSSPDNAARTGGKLKRVRTIFTAEQLERLEDEFTRQQYMVGPERLYLAHALRLTEAQVKVWFQNRRIKWRKHNHEQTSQRLHELHQRSIAEREDSNENTPEW